MWAEVRNIDDIPTEAGQSDDDIRLAGRTIIPQSQLRQRQIVATVRVLLVVIHHNSIFDL